MDERTCDVRVALMAIIEKIERLLSITGITITSLKGVVVFSKEMQADGKIIAEAADDLSKRIKDFKTKLLVEELTQDDYPSE